METQQNTTEVKYMIVGIGEKTFAIPMANVREVIAYNNVSPVPTMPNYFAGLINLRGKVVSTIHLETSLKMVPSQNKNENAPKGKVRKSIVVLDVANAIYGVIVDRVLEVLPVTDSNIGVINNTQDTRDMFAGIIKIENKPLSPILNLTRAMRLDELLSANLASEREMD